MRLKACATADAAVLLLAGCSPTSTSSSVPVESGSASGGVAAVGGPCPQGPPARGTFSGVQDAGHDGVVGSLRNDTGSTVYVRGWDGGNPCTLAPGESVAYAGSRRALWLQAEGKLPKWVRSQGFDGESSVDWDGALLVSRGPEGGSPGVAILLMDPSDGYPSAYSMFRTADGGVCGSANDKWATNGLSEGQEATLSGAAPGTVVVKRLADDKNAARQWSGLDSWKVNDWARLDVTVTSVGTC